MAIVRVKILNSALNSAYENARQSFPVIPLERPVQYYQRWEETYSCRIRGDYMEFPNEETYTWFILKWQ